MSNIATAPAPANTQNGHRQTFLPPDFSKLPTRLAGFNRWVVWKAIWKADLKKWIKMPYGPQNHTAFERIMDEKGLVPECVTLEEVKKIFAHNAKAKGWTGVGFSVHGTEGICFLDFDGAVEDGAIKNPELARLIAVLNTYTEISPSGTGLRVVANLERAVFNLRHNPEKQESTQFVQRYGCRGVEVWTEGKYATLTGRLYAPELCEVQPSGAPLETFIEEFGRVLKGSDWMLRPPPESTTKREKTKWDPEKLQEVKSEDLKGALSHLDPDMDVEEWIKIGFALHTWNKEEGLKLWEEWSSGGNKFCKNYSKGRTECAVRWKGFQADKANGVTVGTVIKLAQDKGWVAPWEQGNNGTASTAKRAPRKIIPSALPDGFNKSDSGNAERLLYSPEGKEMRYFTSPDTWLTWNGRFWEENKEGIACQRLARSVIRRALAKWRKDIPNPKKRAWIEDFCMRSESLGSLRATVSVAKSIPDFQINDPDLLDGDPVLLNCKNGVMNLRTGQLEAHRPELLCTKMTSVAVDTENDCPMWRENLLNYMCGDEELFEAVSVILGATLTGYAPEWMCIFYGATASNGKSTVMETCYRLLGTYAGRLKADALVKDKFRGGESASPNIAGLRGARMVLADEWRESDKMDEAILKQICSQDQITARYMYANPISFKPTHTILFRSQHLPRIDSNDPGAWRRIKAIPWEHEIPESKRNETFVKLLIQKEGPAILGWLCRQAMKFVALHESGSPLPTAKRMTVLKEEYRKESNLLARWAEEELKFGSGVETSVQDLRTSFEAFAVANGEDPKRTSVQGLAKFLKLQKCVPVRNKSFRGWSGVAIVGGESQATMGAL